ncbi:MAG: DUF6516 family protein [Candidatus Woesearchaeota archaeon]
MKAKDINMCPDRTYKSRLLRYSRFNLRGGENVAIRVWEVPKDANYPEGLKYSFAYIRGQRRILGYDNYEGKGHHRHLGEGESEIRFRSVEEIERQFKKEVKKLRGHYDKGETCKGESPGF